MNMPSTDPKTAPDFTRVRSACRGMMPADAYERLYSYGLQAPNTTFLEVGTGGGAGTISLALAIKARGGHGRVHTFDRLMGGSRSAVGTVDDNIAALNARFRAFGVEDLVGLHVGEAGNLARPLGPDERYGLVFLDADGRIDRDLADVSAQLSPDAIVILDDCADHIGFYYEGLASAVVDLKALMTYKLAQKMVELGVLTLIERCNQTCFFRYNGVPITRDDYVEVYREQLYHRIPMGIGRLTLYSLKRRIRRSRELWLNRQWRSQ